LFNRSILIYKKIRYLPTYSPKGLLLFTHTHRNYSSILIRKS